MRKTLENLTKAFVGESQARNRYTIYAKIALKEGYNQVSDIFLLTAEQEREHASWFWKMLQSVKEKLGETSDHLVIETSASHFVGDTLHNLQSAMAGENEEHTMLYPEFARVAQEEGLPEIAARIKAIMIAEQHHENRYAKLHEQIKLETVFQKSESISWYCTKCGYAHQGSTPPKICPSCGHEHNYFIVDNETY